MSQMSLKYLTEHEFARLNNRINELEQYIAKLTTQPWTMCKCGHTLEEHDESGCMFCYPYDDDTTSDPTCSTFRVAV